MKVVRQSMFAMLILAACSPLFAQVTIHFDDFPYQIGSVLTRGYGMNVIAAGQAAENMTWDYSTIPDAFTSTESFVNPVGQPGAETFPNATLAMTQAYDGEIGSVVYYQHMNNNIMLVGFVLISGENAYPVPVDANGPRLNFPMTYGDEWNDVTSVEFGEDTQIDSTHFIVDAWGVMTDVSGTYNCLRIRMNNIHTTLPDNEVETKIRYMWVAQDYGEICLIESNDNETDPNFNTGDFERISDIQGWVNVREFGADLANDFVLTQVYPNPFNPTSTVRVSLPQTAELTVSVFNTTGQEVALLAKKLFNAGTHTFTLDGSSLTTGMYFVHVNASGHTSQVQKVILIR
ncbi:T9SS type A sorting domain-containing protein [bacterium]|nr:T9SS type A sorting domain-containing protein [bacterium]